MSASGEPEILKNAKIVGEAASGKRSFLTRLKRPGAERAAVELRDRMDDGPAVGHEVEVLAEMALDLFRISKQFAVSREQLRTYTRLYEVAHKEKTQRVVAAMQLLGAQATAHVSTLSSLPVDDSAMPTRDVLLSALSQINEKIVQLALDPTLI